MTIRHLPPVFCFLQRLPHRTINDYTSMGYRVYSFFIGLVFYRIVTGGLFGFALYAECHWHEVRMTESSKSSCVLMFVEVKCYLVYSSLSDVIYVGSFIQPISVKIKIIFCIKFLSVKTVLCFCSACATKSSIVNSRQS
jgi:hypothetical protein